MFRRFVIGIVVVLAVMLMASRAYTRVDDTPPIPASLANVFRVGEEIVLGRVERDGEVYPWAAEDNQPAYTLPLLRGEIAMSAFECAIHRFLKYASPSASSGGSRQALNVPVCRSQKLECTSAA